MGQDWKVGWQYLQCKQNNERDALHNKSLYKKQYWNLTPIHTDKIYKETVLCLFLYFLEAILTLSNHGNTKKQKK